MALVTYEATLASGMSFKPVKTVAVLFARQDSIYKSFPCCDVYDLARDALTFNGKKSVVVHPPCRAWSRLAHLAKPRVGEKELAFFALEQVRKNGGILEHPFGSQFWKSANLPRPGFYDSCGFNVYLEQIAFGHRAVKPTWLYVSGCSLDQINIPPVVKSPSMPVQNMNVREREATPPLFAEWLVDLASRCGGVL